MADGKIFRSTNYEDTESEVTRTEQFMTDWTSTVFRGLCADKIEGARVGLPPPPASGDPVLVFLAQKSSPDLEEFVFAKSTSREDYLAYVMEIVQMFRKHARTCGVNQDETGSS